MLGTLCYGMGLAWNPGFPTFSPGASSPPWALFSLLWNGNTDVQLLASYVSGDTMCMQACLVPSAWRVLQCKCNDIPSYWLLSAVPHFPYREDSPPPTSLSFLSSLFVPLMAYFLKNGLNVISRSIIISWHDSRPEVLLLPRWKFKIWNDHGRSFSGMAGAGGALLWPPWSWCFFDKEVTSHPFSTSLST